MTSSSAEMQILRETQRRKGVVLLQEIIMEKVSHLKKYINLTTQEVQRTPNRLSVKVATLTHTVTRVERQCLESRWCHHPSPWWVMSRIPSRNGAGQRQGNSKQKLSAKSPLPRLPLKMRREWRHYGQIQIFKKKKLHCHFELNVTAHSFEGFKRQLHKIIISTC